MRAACVFGGVRHQLERPLFVLATQNPIEQEGTYPLPEAQLDRFMFNVVISYLTEDDEVRVVTQTTGTNQPKPTRVLSGPDILQFQEWGYQSRWDHEDIWDVIGCAGATNSPLVGSHLKDRPIKL